MQKLKRRLSDNIALQEKLILEVEEKSEKMFGCGAGHSTCAIFQHASAEDFDHAKVHLPAESGFRKPDTATVNFCIETRGSDAAGKENDKTAEKLKGRQMLRGTMLLLLTDPSGRLPRQEQCRCLPITSTALKR